MTLEIQFKIKNNPYYLSYLRKNSNWYKILNRNPEMFGQFEEEVKEKYKLRPSDRISQALDTITMIQNVMSSFK